MIHVVARSEQSADLFLKRNISLVSNTVIELGQRSYFDLLNRVIKNSHDDYACIVHDDVFLCSDFNDRIDSLVTTLNHDWPSWGLAGNSGITPFKVGYSSTQLIRYLADPHGGPNLIGQILPATSIDGNIMLLNIRALRERQVHVPSFDGFQLYDIILSIETISSGLGVFIAPHLACYHDSTGNQEHFELAKNSESFLSYISNRLKNRSFLTLNGTITAIISEHINSTSAIDIDIESLRSACNYRPSRTVAIVTRTQFTRPELLDRCLRTISSFIASAGSATNFESYIVTDRDPPPELVLQTKIIKSPTEPKDTRFKLVQIAAQQINADYFWFIDDDDWMFPNEAERISMVISCAPKNSVFFVDSCQYYESPYPTGDLSMVGLYRSTKRRYFSAIDYIKSLRGINESPFCGVIYNRNSLLNISDKVYNSIIYYEDFMCTLNALLSGSIPIVVNKLYAGISIRESGNTVTDTNRVTWNTSMSVLVSNLVNEGSYYQLVSLPINEFFDDIELTNIKRQLDIITSSKSWRITRPLRAAARLIRGQITIKDLISRLMMHL